MPKAKLTSANGSALTTDEREMLAKLEVELEHNATAMWTNLVVIRDQKLYRDEYKTFEVYCKERWGISRSRAYQLVEAGEVAAEMSTNGGHPPTKERQLRALAKAPPEKREEVMNRAKATAAKTDKPTAVEVRRAVVETMQPEKPAAPDPQPWLTVNALVDRIIDAIREASDLTKLVGKSDFGGWIDVKKLDTFWSNARVTFETHKVARWANEVEKRKHSRPFLYACEAKKTKGAA